MFIYDFVYIDLPWETVSAQILDDRGSWLAPLVRDAQQDGEDLRIRVGIGGDSRWIGKEVRVTLGAPRSKNDCLVVGLTWDATGMKTLFPRLEADLEIAPFGDECTQITLSGRYSPPLGRAGELLDASLLHRVAEATVRSFLQRMADAFENQLDMDAIPDPVE